MTGAQFTQFVEAMKEKGHTQRAIARRLGMTPESISHMKKRGCPKPTELACRAVFSELDKLGYPWG